MDSHDGLSILLYETYLFLNFIIIIPVHIFSLTGYNHFGGWSDVSFIVTILSIYRDAIQSGPRMNTGGIDLNPSHSMEPGSVNPQSEEELHRQAFPSPGRFQ